MQVGAITDERGNLVTQTYFDVDEQPCLQIDNYASAAASYDRYGRMIEAAFLGLDGLPIDRKGGYAKAVRSHSPDGEPTNAQYFDAVGAEIFPDVEEGWTFKFDE